MIPVLMTYALRKKVREGLPAPLAKVIGLFVAFILCCGLTHLNEAIIFYHPFYRFAGVVKAITAAVSWLTVMALIPALPQLLALHTTGEMGDEVATATLALKVERDLVQRELEARRRVEAALLDAEARYRDLYENAPDMFLTLDLDGLRILHCNATAHQRLGILPEDLVGTHFLELCSADSQPMADKVLAELTAESQIENAELTLLTLDGEELEVSLNATLVETAPDGRQARTTLRDITNKNKAVRLFELAVEACPSGMLAVDMSGKIVLANTEAERLFGYGAKELMGSAIENLVPDDVRHAHPGLRKSYLKQPSARKMVGARPLMGRKKNGETFPIEVGLSPIETPDGVLVLSAIIDHTEIVEQRERLVAQQHALEKTNEELESFASAASHDLKAPLRAIQNATAWIEEDLPEEFQSGEVGENLALLRNRAARMEALLNALLDYARAGRDEATLAEVSCSDILTDIVTLLGPEAEAALHAQGDMPRLLTARAPLQQVLYNLIANGLKHCERDDPRIEVRAMAFPGGHEFSISDNGPGIDPAYHGKIFDVFRTLHSRDEREGAGMGLALVKKIVEGRGGVVKVESTPGEGALFRFTWPL